MFKPVKATTIKEYMDMLEPRRRTQIEQLDAFIRKTVPSLKPHFASNMLGYGSFPYKNYKKEDIEWPVIMLASQKQHISLYICSTINKEYLAEKYKDTLGKVKVGKSCIRINKLEDVDMEGLAKVLKLAEEHQGFT